MDANPPDPPPPPDPNPFEPPQASIAPRQPTRLAPASVLSILLGAVAVVLASVIAFVATCVPVGFVALSMGGEKISLGIALGIAFLAGTGAAIGVGFALSRWFQARRRARTYRDQDEVDR